MRIAICSAGPSLRQGWPGRSCFDLVLAVNAASILVDADWQISGDVEAWQAARRPRVGVCAPRTILQACQAGEYDRQETYHTAGVSFKGLRGIEWQDLYLANKPHECNYSICAALALAIELGATGRLEIYGADMGGGNLDCAGVVNHARNAARWAVELADLAHIATHARLQGAHPVRILPTGIIPC